MRLNLLILCVFAGHPALGAGLILQSTTSTKNSGLYDHILPEFTAETGIEVHVVAVGTGQALQNAWNCDGDVVLVHSKADEEAFVARGGGLARFDLMTNDFVLIGPPADPAGIQNSATITAALTQIRTTESGFASRSDLSGTHRKEMTLWDTADLDPKTGSGDWYFETGAGMGTTLNIAVGLDAYTLSDRATWSAFQNKGDHQILFEGGAALINQYGIIQVSPTRCPNVETDAAKRFIDWMISEPGQSAIARYTVNGQQVFFPNAKRD